MPKMNMKTAGTSRRFSFECGVWIGGSVMSFVRSFIGSFGRSVSR